MLYTHFYPWKCCFFLRSRKPFEYVLVTLKYTHLRPLDLTRPMRYTRQLLERPKRCRSCCLCRSVASKAHFGGVFWSGRPLFTPLATLGISAFVG